MDVGRYLVEAHLREGRSIGELARAHGVHRSWLYKLRRRYRAEGEAGLAPRSRRPHRSPTALPLDVAAATLRLRTALLAQLDHPRAASARPGDARAAQAAALLAHTLRGRAPQPAVADRRNTLGPRR